MKKFITMFLIIAIVFIQVYVIFLADYPIARSLIAAHITLDCGKMFDQGIVMFMERKHKFNLVLFGTSMILVIMILLKHRKTKSE